MGQTPPVLRPPGMQFNMVDIVDGIQHFHEAEEEVEDMTEQYNSLSLKKAEDSPPGV